jgi:hypothetical protein
MENFDFGPLFSPSSFLPFSLSPLYSRANIAHGNFHFKLKVEPPVTPARAGGRPAITGNFTGNCASDFKLQVEVN